MASIDMVEIGNIENRWGVKAGDYDVTLNNKTDQMDFQDLLVKFSKNRAVAVEGEVEPLTVRIQQRNKRLDELGEALAELTEMQTSFDSESKGSDACSRSFTDEAVAVMKSLGFSVARYEDVVAGKITLSEFFNADIKQYSANNAVSTKMVIDGMISRVKSEIDGLNNEAQTDMTRLQSLVDRRDESYSTATNLMTSISDTRSNVIRNM